MSGHSAGVMAAKLSAVSSSRRECRITTKSPGLSLTVTDEAEAEAEAAVGGVVAVLVAVIDVSSAVEVAVAFAACWSMHGALF